MVEYYFDNIPLCRFKGWTESWTGLFTALDRKEPERVDYPGQHGYRFDRSTIRFKERVITMTLVFNTDCMRELIRDDMKKLMELLSKNRPIRLKRVDNENLRTDVWDVDLISSGSDRWFDDQMGQRTLTLHETAPVKVVYYNANVNDLAQVAIESPNTLLISWGDGTFEKTKTGATHEYNDGWSRHYVIVSGVITEAEITTNMQEVCRILC